MITSEMMDEALIKMRDEINNEIIPKAKEISAEIRKVASDERLKFMQTCLDRYRRGHRINDLYIHGGLDSARIDNNEATMIYKDFSIMGLPSRMDYDFLGEEGDYRNEWYIGVKNAHRFTNEQYFLNYKYERLMRCAANVKNARDLISSVDRWLPGFVRNFEEWYNKMVAIDTEETSKFNEMFGTSPSVGKIKVEVKVYNFDGNEE